ncbi:MAG: RDD family protein [Turicibacter sp.]|nr:RDD family protein [Turicibacter sp.]MDO5793024.1 RDD family protein [Turicibacter sp.]
MILRRLIAEFIDIAILIGGTAAGIYLAGQLNTLFDESFFLLTLSEVCVIVLVPILLQSLFWLENTTIGKTMVFCTVESIDETELNYFSMMTREYISKVFSCYLVCLPVLFGKKGLHEIVTNSVVKLKLKRG